MELGQEHNIKTLRSKDFYSGLIFIFFGVVALVRARHYPMGTAARMGPGYFPIILGGLLAILGLVIAARALFWVPGEPIRGWAFRPLLLVIGGVLAFALLVQPLGLVLAILTLVVICSLGSWEFRIKELFILSIALAALAIALFVYGLGMPYKLWPT
jgi:hypothetical protein